MPGLLDPLIIRDFTFRNRIVMPPLWSGKATTRGEVTDAIVEYHRLRAAAGCGLVITEHAYVHPWGRNSVDQLGIHTDDNLAGFERLAGAIREEGAVAVAQLAHAGSKTTAAVAGRVPLAPSACLQPHLPEGELPEAMTPAHIEELIEAFARAARRAVDAGFNGVEVHSAHGFLLSQFLSPLTNHRADAYGGSLGARAQLLVEILGAVRDRIGPEPLLLVRLAATDETPGGVEIAESCEVAGWLVEVDVDLLDVSGGLQGSRPAGRGPGYYVPYARAIREATGCPVIATGGITEAAQAEAVVRARDADLVGIGRAMLKDPAWAEKAIASLDVPG